MELIKKERNILNFLNKYLKKENNIQVKHDTQDIVENLDFKYDLEEGNQIYTIDKTTNIYIIKHETIFTESEYWCLGDERKNDK